MFLHGSGFSGWMWENVIGHLPDFYCMAITLPGHGLSADQKWVSLDETAKQITQIIDDELGDMNIHLVGLSLGGHVALQLMSQQPSFFKSAILSCILYAPLPKPDQHKFLTDALMPLSHIPVLQKIVAKRFGMTGEKVSRYLQEVRKIDRETLKKSSLEIANIKLPENLSAISTRILLLAGERERSPTRGALPKYQSNLPNARSAILPKYRYGWSGKRPGLFAKTIRAQIKNETLPDEMIEQELSV